jgi:ABC-type amino acid transport substrate-binding protein
VRLRGRQPGLPEDPGRQGLRGAGHAAGRSGLLRRGAGIAVRKNDAALQQKFNAAIQAIRANGTYKKVESKYFDFDIYGK